MKKKPPPATAGDQLLGEEVGVERDDRDERRDGRQAGDLVRDDAVVEVDERDRDQRVTSRARARCAIASSWAATTAT